MQRFGLPLVIAAEVALGACHGGMIYPTLVSDKASSLPAWIPNNGNTYGSGNQCYANGPIGDFTTR